MAQMHEPAMLSAARRASRSPLGRRTLLAAAAAVLAHRGAAGASPPEPPFPSGASVLIAGPRGGPLDHYADSLLPALARGLPADTELRRSLAGGADGVTAANQFEARSDPDGTSLLMVPGEAALAWLIGDPRARFDASRLVPVLAGVAPWVLMGRPAAEMLASGGTVRLASFRPGDPALVGLLALDLLGLRAQPAFGFADADDVTQAVAAAAADAAVVTGPQAPLRMAALARLGMVPLLTLDSDAGAVPPDPLLAAVPTLPELATRLRGAPPAGPLYDAWRAAAAAARLSFLLALPALTPSALVALWRQAAIQAAPLVTPPAGGGALRVFACPDANRMIEPLATADVNALFELRRWLGERMKWQPA